MDLTADIKNRLTIEDVVSQYVPLKKMGRHFKALCPFHNEKTPSFVVSPEKGLAYCFGCHRGGDIFKFVQEIEKVEFSDALKILAEKAGLNMEHYRMVQPKVKKAEKDLLYDQLEKDAEFYEEQLESEQGKSVKKYLHDRGIIDETIRKFRLGYAPKREEDRFSGRLIFPIFDERGKVVGFGGRALAAGQEPKYLNSSESAVYHKSEILYGFDCAKSAIREKNSAIVVEGYMDALMSHQAGFSHVVACSGTAFTEPQAKLLKRFCNEIVLALDNDTAGFEATIRSFLILDAVGVNVKVLQIPSGKDPADALKDDRQKFEEALESAKSFLPYYMDCMMRQYDAKTPEGARELLKAVLPFIKSIQSRLTQDFYLRELALRMHIKEQILYDELKRLKSEPRSAGQGGTALSPQSVQVAPSEKWTLDDYFMSLVIEFPDLLLLSQTVVSVDDLLSPHGEHYLNLPNRPDDPYFDLHALYAEEKYGNFSAPDREREFLKIVDRIHKRRYSKRCDELRNRLKDAEIRGDRSLKEAVLSELSSLLHAHS